MTKSVFHDSNSIELIWSIVATELYTEAIPLVGEVVEEELCGRGAAAAMAFPTETPPFSPGGECFLIDHRSHDATMKWTSPMQ